MDERDDLKRIETDPGPRWFAPEALRPIHDLNRRLLSILVEESRRRDGATSSTAALGEQLVSLDEEILWRLARVPISLVDAEFQLDEAWSAAAAGKRRDTVQLSESPLPRARALELAALTFGFAATTARSSRESARLIFGMSPVVADAFAGFTVDVVNWLGQARAHWVRPRWHDRPQEWRRLIETAEHAEAARLPPVGVRAMNRLLADLEPATSAESETRHSRR
jgi:hypothetical protein